MAVGLLALFSFACESTPVSAPGDGQIILSVNPSTVILDENSTPPVTSATALVTAQFFDTNGVPIPNVSVIFSTDGGELDSAPPGQPAQPLETDDNGFVSDTLTLVIGDPDDVQVTVRSGTLTDSITVDKFERPANQAPFADVFIDPQNSALINETVIYDGTGSADPDGDTITCYQWQIESTENINSPALACTPANPRCEISQGPSTSIITRSYSAEQNIAVTLRVTDDPSVVCSPSGPAEDPSVFGGVIAAAYEVVCDRTLPSAAAGPNQVVALNGGASVSVPLSGSASFDTESGIVDYQWNCGNGTLLSGAAVVCDYTTAGTYSATLVVTNGCGLVNQDAAIITVNP